MELHALLIGLDLSPCNPLLPLLGAGLGALPPAGPGIPIAIPISGPNPGEVTLTITGAPAAGDLAVNGDGLGVITAYRTRINRVPASYSPALPITRTVGGLPPEAPVLVQWWALGSNGRPGAVGAAYVVPGAMPVGIWVFAPGNAGIDIQQHPAVLGAWNVTPHDGRLVVVSHPEVA